MKNAEIGKQGIESNKSDQIPKLIDGGQVEGVCSIDRCDK